MQSGVTSPILFYPPFFLLPSTGPASSLFPTITGPTVKSDLNEEKSFNILGVKYITEKQHNQATWFLILE